jgi:hypothetical protein
VAGRPLGARPADTVVRLAVPRLGALKASDYELSSGGVSIAAGEPEVDLPRPAHPALHGPLDRALEARGDLERQGSLRHSQAGTGCRKLTHVTDTPRRLGDALIPPTARVDHRTCSARRSEPLHDTYQTHAWTKSECLVKILPRTFFSRNAIAHRRTSGLLHAGEGVAGWSARLPRPAGMNVGPVSYGLTVHSANLRSCRNSKRPADTKSIEDNTRMEVGHTDSDEAKAVDLRETRRRFLFARERASKCSPSSTGRSASCAAGRYRNGAQVFSSTPETA